MATAGRLTLRALTRSLNNSQVQLQNVATTTQKRSVGNLPVKANSYIENWAHKRENVELTFKFDAKTLSLLGFFGLLTPYCVYNMTISEFQSMQELAGKPKKKYWGS